MNRRKARETAFTLLFQVDINEGFPVGDEVLNEYTTRVIDGVLENKTKLDDIISDNVENWSYDRVGLVEKTILRIAAYELMFLDDIPDSVSINEAVELSHTYGDEKTSKFVNGILSKIMKQKEE